MRLRTTVVINKVTGKGFDMISKVDYYLGVFLVMLAVVAVHRITSVH